MTLADALAAEDRGEGSVRFVDGVPIWSRSQARFGRTSVPVHDVDAFAKRRSRLVAKRDRAAREIAKFDERALALAGVRP